MIVTQVSFNHPDSIDLRSQQRAEIERRYGTPDSEPGPAPTAPVVASTPASA